MGLGVGFSADIRDSIRPREQLLQEGGIGVFHMLGDLSEQVLQVFIRLQTIRFCCLDEAVDRGAGFSAVYGIKDMPIVATDAERTDRSLTGGIIYGNAAILQEHPQIALLVFAVTEAVSGLF